MSYLLAGGVAFAYATAVVGLHRLQVRRMRRASGGFQALRRLDWDTLLQGLLPDPAVPPDSRLSTVGCPLPGPQILARPPASGAEERHAALCALLAGVSPKEEALLAAGFSGGQVRWLKTLSYLSADAEQALQRLESGELNTVAELYLREHLSLEHRTHAVNLELQVFSSKRRLGLALRRFGEHPALFFARAQASALLGFNQAAIDDLARAVYFSRQAPFYLRAVLDTPYIAEVRPALAQQCRQAPGSGVRSPGEGGRSSLRRLGPPS